ncbi:MAG: hypothetical protein B1H06_01255 [Candidatus Cloacimonas sp. 4484_143]|nr:MAG: hypothetical protein B1H06_01255 [Candidatus Cloacimonas sp. 4484_143]
MRKFVIVLILLSIVFSLSAQQKSIRKAMAFSAILPGAGEIYTKNYNKAAVFLAVEAATIFSYFRLKNERQWAMDSYKQFAYSVTDVPKDSEDSYYQVIQNYFSSERYNENILRDARNYFIIYTNDPVGYEEYLDKYLVPEDQSWNWGNDRNWYIFRGLRRDKQDMEIYMKFAFAAAILNRFISVVDSAISAKRCNKQGQTISKFSIYPDIFKKELKVRYEYKF